MQTTAPVLQVRNLRKEYPGTIALDGVSMTFRSGKVHALIGKNGAGKSTLVKILSGATRPSSGEISLSGGEVSFHSPSDAFARGIAMVYQEMSLIPELSVAENILLGRMPKARKLGLPLIDWNEACASADGILQSLGARIDVKKKVSRLDLAQQQIVEIAKAMSLDPQVLLLDEPTSALSYQGAEGLFRLIRDLRSCDVIILYITHRIQELKKIADDVSVLRDGRVVGQFPIEESSPAVIARMMFGEETLKTTGTPSTAVEPGTEAERVLEVLDLNVKGVLHDINFSVKAGEVLGIAGMLGSGRTELLRALFGADRIDSGEVRVRGKKIGTLEPAEVKRHGIGFIPENRKEDGLIQMLTVKDNLSLPILGKISRAGIIRRNVQNAIADETIRDLQIAVRSRDQEVSALSGGNQQKVVIGKWLNTTPSVILFDEPTRGIDIQAKQQIFALIGKLSREGVGCVFVSAELEELLEICQRILIMSRGRIRGEFLASTLSVEKLFAECMKEDAASDSLSRGDR